MHHYNLNFRFLPARPRPADILSNKIVYLQHGREPHFACPDNSNFIYCVGNLTAAFIGDGQFTFHNAADYAYQIIHEVVHAIFRDGAIVAPAVDTSAHAHNDSVNYNADDSLPGHLGGFYSLPSQGKASVCPQNLQLTVA